MKIEALPVEVVLVTLKLENGSSWVTNYRLITCEHQPGNLEGQTAKTYLLKNLQSMQIDGQALTAHFKEKEEDVVRLQISAKESWTLEGIKGYIEGLSEWNKLPADKRVPPFESRCWMMFPDFVDNEQLCPCGSGKVAYKCCIPRMPRDHIIKWFLRSQGKKVKFSVVDKFISLWIAFVSWSEFQSDGETDREILRWLKKSPFLLEIFQLLAKDPEFQDALKGIRGIPIHRYIRDEQVTIRNTKDIGQVLEFIYVLRCNLFHGHEDLEDEYLVSHCFVVLSKIFAKIMEKDDQLNTEPGKFLELFDSYSFW